MARVQIFSESPISPSTQSKDPQAFIAASGPEGGGGSQVSEVQQESSLAQHNFTQDHTDQLGTAQRPPAAEHQLQSPQDEGEDRTQASARSRSGSPRMTLPPPPKAGESLKPSSYYALSPSTGSQVLHAPRSASTSPRPPPEHLRGSPRNGFLSPTSPQDAALPTPKSAPLPRKSLEHPPGYVQNPYAADLTPEQRFATQHSPASPTLGYGNGNGSNTGGILGSKSPSSIFSFGALTSPLGGRDGLSGENGQGSGEDWWSVVGGWAKGMGKKVGEVESEVWRRINGERT